VFAEAQEGVDLINLVKSAVAVAILSLSLATAQTLTGTVTNGTTNKPAAGDEVILINLANGMDVAATTKADSAGKFSFKLPGAPGPHLIRAVHQGVTYHQMAPPGTDSVEVKVYDVSKHVSGLNVTADVVRLQGDSTTLQGTRLFAVNNISSPPTTQLNDRNFEFFLPPGAKIEESQARAPNGQPINAEATPQAEKNRYAMAFPLRPGETQFQIVFSLPYSGQIKIDPKLLYPAEHFVVVTPKSMHFAPNDASLFKSMQDPTQADTMVQVAQETKVGQPLAFTLRGTGTISDAPAQVSGAGPQDQSQGQSSAPDNRPGGGLGAPIDAPDALQKYRWPILGAFALLLAVGGWVVTKRQPVISAASSAGAATATKTGVAASDLSAGFRPENRAEASIPISSPPIAATSVPRSAMLLEALKEELFQLEIEKKQGKITAADYEKARAALDQTLDRALKRQG
jgi:hypothetical protein